VKYQCIGNPAGQLMVFINGAATGPWMWEELSKYLTDYKLLMFDLPGHGENSHVDFLSIEQVANQLVQWIKTESSNGKAIVVGLSIGGQTVAHMLKHYHSYIEYSFIISCLNKKSKFLANMSSMMVGLSMPLVKYRWFAKAQVKNLKIPDTMFEFYYRDSLLMSKRSLTNILIANQLFEIEDQVDIKRKATIILGENEVSMIHRSAVSLCKNFGLTEYISFKDCGHGIPYEAPKALSDLIQSVLKAEHIRQSPLYSIVKI